MTQELRPLYGELVIPYDYKEQTSISNEIDAMEEQLQWMIEEAAYFLAEKRGFAPGHELDDWLKATQQIKGR